MLQKIKNPTLRKIIEFISDVRNLGLLGFAVVAVIVTWSGVKVVQTNYDLQKQISAMRQANGVKQLENSNLELSNQYYKTDAYLELSARKLHNKALSGEKLLIVPEAVALNHTIEIAEPEPDNRDMGEIEKGGPWYERNFNAWVDFLFRSRTPEN